MVVSLRLTLLLGLTLAPPTFAVASQVGQSVEPELRRIAGFDAAVNDPVLSPDGKWVAVSVEEGSGGGSAIWLIPSLGGEARRLTGSGHVDVTPRWFPSSDRVAFLSDRAVTGGDGLLPWAVRFDPATAAPVSVRQLGIEEVAMPASLFEISADGRRICFVAEDPSSHSREIRSAPIEGGRSVAHATSLHHILTDLKWTSEGEALIYVELLGAAFRVTKVDVKTGAAEVVGNYAKPVLLAADGNSILVLNDEDADGSTTWLQLTPAGQPLRTFRLTDRLTVGRLEKNGLLTSVRTDRASRLWRRSITGGSAYPLTERFRSGFITDWSPANNRILAINSIGEEEFLVSMSPETGAYEVLANFEDLVGVPRSSGAGRDVILLEPAKDPETHRRQVLWDPNSDERRVLTELFPKYHNFTGTVLGRGGTEFRDEGATLVLATDGGMATVWATTVEGDSTMLLRVREDDLWMPIAVFGDSTARPSYTSDGMGVQLQLNGSDGVAGIVPLPESMGIYTLSWSHDGRVLAVTTDAGDAASVHFFAREQSRLVPRSVRSVPARAVYSMLWRHDDSGVLLEAEKADASGLLFVPIRKREPVVGLTDDDSGTVRSFALEPGGDDVVYVSSSVIGSSVWLLTAHPLGEGTARP